MTLHTMPAKPTRVTHQVHTYTGPDTDKIVSDLLRARFTGPITLHISAGRVATVEWKEKVGGQASSVA